MDTTISQALEAAINAFTSSLIQNAERANLVLMERLAHLEGRVDAVPQMIDDVLENYNPTDHIGFDRAVEALVGNPTEHNDFEDAVKDLVKEVQGHVIRNFLNDKVTVSLDIN